MSGRARLPAVTTVAAQGGLDWQRMFLWALFYLMPFADAATGYLVLSGAFPEAAAGSVSQLVRGGLIVPALLLLRGRWTYAAALPIFYVVALESFMLMLHQQPGWFAVGMVYDFKIAYLFIVYLALREISGKVPGGISIARYFVQGAILYGAILLLSTLLGLHTPTYGDGTTGTKGLFASGNALGLYLGCAALVALDGTHGSSSRTAFLQAAFLIICCAMVGTKASLIFVVLFLGLSLYRAHAGWKALVLALSLTSVMLYAEQIGATLSLLFDVILFRYQNSDSLFAFIASGRDVYVRDALAVFDPQGWNVWRLLFGTGAFVSFRSIDGLPMTYDTLESDLFDIFFAYGAVGIAAYLLVIAWGLLLALRARRPALLLAWCATCFYSAAAGHIAFNAMSGLCIPVLLIALQRSRPNVLAGLTSTLPERDHPQDQQRT